METEFKHIVKDEDGRLWIEDTNLKVLELVLACQAYGWGPEEYHLQHPEISMSKICAAMAYYYEHQSEMDQEIRNDLDWAEAERDRNLAETAEIRDRLRRFRQKSA